MSRKTCLFLLLTIPLLPLAFFLFQESKVAGNFGFPLDDSWIFWVFAKNLATGQGFSFNAGEPILGTTSILWVLVLAGTYLVSHSVVFISKFWGAIFYCLSMGLTYKICLYHTQKAKVAWLGVLSVALLTPMIFGALSGMEIPLATFVFCLTLYFHLKERGKAQRIFLAPIFGALCFVTRPELIGLYPLLIVSDFFTRRRITESQKGGTSTTSGLGMKALTFILSLLTFIILTYILTGSVLPHTLSAKSLDSGLVWAMKNVNLSELLVSMTLDPFIFGGTMLITLVGLNIFWAFFWGRGMVSSFFRKETWVYPLIFLLIPAVRGMVAPVGNSFFGEHRYVSFLLPLLSVFFVIGWEGFDLSKADNSSLVRLRKWLVLIAGVSLILAIMFFINPLVKKNIIWGFFARYYFPAIQAKVTLFNYPEFRFFFWFTVIFVIGVTWAGTTKFLKDRAEGRKIVYCLLIAGAVLQIGVLNNRAQRFALSVKNINEQQVHLGKWMNQNLPPHALVAINDIGAIKFFGNRKCLDLEGLVTPQIVPYKILSRDSYLAFLNKNRPDYFIIFPLWYPAIYGYLDLWERILYKVELGDNIASGGRGRMIVAEPNWALFDSSMAKEQWLEIKPYFPKKSLKRRWSDAQEQQELLPAWRVYEIKGKEAEIARDVEAAEKFYQKTETLDPQNSEFYLTLLVFYRDRGDSAKAAWACEKATVYQLFPFPNFRAMLRR